jgi:hypothetical protein
VVPPAAQGALCGRDPSTGESVGAVLTASAPSPGTIPEQVSFLGFEVLTAVVFKSSFFWDITPCSSLKFNRNIGGSLPLAFTLGSCLAYYSIIKIEAICSFETSVDLQRTTRHYIRENRTLQVSFEQPSDV